MMFGGIASGVDVGSSVTEWLRRDDVFTKAFQNVTLILSNPPSDIGLEEDTVAMLRGWRACSILVVRDGTAST